MPLVIIQTSPLSTDQKKRIGDRIIASLHSEGVPAASVVVLFQPDTSDVFLDGGLVHELKAAPQVVPQTAMEPVSFREAPVFRSAEEAYKSKARRNREELSELRKRLVSLLEDQGGLSSFKAQEDLGLKDCDWAPATLRRLFGELEQEGLIVKQGQKRGTRYVWAGLSANSTAQPVAKLVKRNLEEGTHSAEAQDTE
jgi:hypothetical protein